MSDDREKRLQHKDYGAPTMKCEKARVVSFSIIFLFFGNTNTRPSSQPKGLAIRIPLSLLSVMRNSITMRRILALASITSVVAGAFLFLSAPAEAKRWHHRWNNNGGLMNSNNGGFMNNGGGFMNNGSGGFMNNGGNGFFNNNGSGPNGNAYGYWRHHKRHHHHWNNGLLNNGGGLLNTAGGVLGNGLNSGSGLLNNGNGLLNNGSSWRHNNNHKHHRMF